MRWGCPLPIASSLFRGNEMSLLSRFRLLAPLADLPQTRSLLGTVIKERYPQLKSQQRFADLIVALEGTENRIRTQRRDYNESVREYNTTIRTFPDAIGARIFYGAK